MRLISWGRVYSSYEKAIVESEIVINILNEFGCDILHHTIINVGGVVTFCIHFIRSENYNKIKFRKQYDEEISLLYS